MFDLRLVAYDPNGARRGLLPHPLSIEVAWSLNDLPALKFAYSAHAVGAELIATSCEIGVQWTVDGNTWTEYPEGRFLLLHRVGDQLDPAAVWRFDCPSYLWTLRKAVVYPHATIAPVNQQRMFSSSATGGFILHTLMTEAQSRGALNGLTWTFTSSIDTAAASWSPFMGMGIPLGTDLLSVLLKLVEFGLLDFRLSGARQLSAWKPNTGVLRDRTMGSFPVILHGGCDIRAAPDVGTLKDMASAAYVVGDGEVRQEVVNVGTPLPWGRWEIGMRQPGLTDSGSAHTAGTAALVTATTERVQRTREITTAEAQWLPLRDYRPGDLILALGNAGAPQPLRIRQVTLSRTVRGVVVGNLVLGDRFEDHDLRMARLLAALAARP
ncbi:hypothetical protein [Nonomuraea lactucae]|uniref:hypothetical protein n=1 Tax=Nonomuraea lactucae TaxID=2249762 RepID=UPI0013B4035C|nr:hypothetical protein [Nonomuraea lactucae]